MMRNLFVFLALFGVIPSVYGAHEFVPLQERAQGQSLVAANLLNDSIYANPAASAFVETYTVNGEYMMPKSFSASILDTKSSGIGGGLGYFREPFPGSTEAIQGAKLSLLGRVTEWAGVGIAGKALWAPPIPDQKNDLKDIDIGTLFRTGFANFGFAVRNVLGGNAALHQPREWAAGARIDYQQLLFLSVATLGSWNSAKPYQYGIGAEYVSPYFFALKGGYRIQPDEHKSYWSAGVSFIAPRIAVHYAFETPTQSGAGEHTEHMIGTMLMF